MAQVVPISDVSTHIDSYLEYLTDVMDDLVEIDAEWDSWTNYEQLDFLIEWDIKRDRLSLLAKWSDQGLFTPSQQVRYHDLLEFIEQRRPILDRLLAE
jgi:hypothetical protein